MQDYPMPVNYKQPIENYKLLRQDLAFLKDIKKTTAPGGGRGTGTAIYGLYRYVPL